MLFKLKMTLIITITSMPYFIPNCSDRWWSIAEILWRQGENAVSAFWRDGDKIPDHDPDHQRRDYRSVRTRANSGDRYELSLRRGMMPRWPDNPSLRFTPLSFIVMCDARSYGRAIDIYYLYESCSSRMPQLSYSKKEFARAWPDSTLLLVPT